MGKYEEMDVLLDLTVCMFNKSSHCMFYLMISFVNKAGDRIEINQ